VAFDNGPVNPLNPDTIDEMHAATATARNLEAVAPHADPPADAVAG
jgi:hypothetical protein